jgi:hypothetical protein
MEYRKKVLPILLFVMIAIAGTGSVYSQSKSEKIKTILIKLFEYCANDDYGNASKFLVYTGEDTTRRYTDVYDYSNENDKKEIVSLCREIKGIVENGGEFEFTQFTTKKETEGVWNTWLVEFQKGSKKKAYFAFLKIKGNYALGDID